MIPFLSSTGGNCHDAVILVEDFAATLKPSGALEGATVEQKMTLKSHSYSPHKRYFSDLVSVKQ